MHGAAVERQSVKPAEDMKQLGSVVILVGLIGESFVGGQSQCAFPSATHRCLSPHATWEIEWREPNGHGRHTLFLKAISGGTPTNLLKFDRSADLLWSPGGRALAITARDASNESVLWVFGGPTLLPPVNIEDRLIATLGRLPEIFRNGHRYYEAVSWPSSDILRFRVRVYDSEAGKQYLGKFRYHMTGKVIRERSK